MADPGEASASEGAVEAALGRAVPGGIDDALVRSRLMASLFGVETAAPRFGRFELREQIGLGGMGVVYRAWDPQLERPVAIKLVDTIGLDASLRERALREARSLAKLSHPNVITVFEAGLADDRVWIAMEYVPGTTMRDWLTRTPRPDGPVILRQWIAVGRGLLAAHAAGLVHRDVKPSNVLMGDDGRPRLIDFGLVRAPQSSDTLSETQIGLTSGSATSLEGVETHGFVGTRAYAAPEQLEGGQVGAAADQYAFCVSVWESLCGRRPPLPGEREGPLLPVPEGVKLPLPVHRALSRGLAMQPSERFASLAELLAELEAAVQGRSRWLGRIAGAATMGALVAGVAVAQLREPAEAVQPCSFDASALDGTWDDARRQGLRERVEGSELEFAAATFASLERGLDDWATGWLDARRAACAATRIEGVQSEAALDLRNACLERKRRAVQVTLDTLLESGEGRALRLAARAPELLAILPGIGDCADPERLAEIEPLPEPGPRRSAVLRGYDVLARARTLAATGAVDEAQARMRELADERDDALGYVPLRLEMQAFPAQLELLRERTGRGIPVLVQVAREAAARRLDELAATLLVEAADAAAGHWSKPELERWLVDEAEVALRRLDRPGDRRAVSLRVAEADLLAQAGRIEEALAAHEQARKLAQELGDEARAEALGLNIAASLADLGRFDEARAALEAGREAAMRRWGAGAPTVGNYEFDLALLALDTGDFETARARLDRAEAIFHAAFGPASITVAQVWSARAKLDLADGEFATALVLVDGALRAYSRELGPEHELLADLHEARGVLRFFTGDLTGSIASYQAALRIRSGVLGPEHPALARLHGNLGESELALGQLDDARASFERALAIYARTLPADHPDLALPLKGRGQVALASGRPVQAVEDLERALQLQLAAGAEPLEIADLRFSLARALAASEGRRSGRASTLALEARADFEAREMREQVATIDAWVRG